MAVSEYELGRIYSNLGDTASVVSSAVARLYLSSPDPRLPMSDPRSLLGTYPSLSENQWTFSHVHGGLVFVIDRAQQTCLFQIYDLKTFALRFEYELYYDIEYVALDSMFHTFEMEGCVAGFSFSSEPDAMQFEAKVKALVPSSSANSPMNVLGSMAKTPYGSQLGGSIFGGGKKKTVLGKLYGSFVNLGSALAKESSENRIMEISPVLAVQHNEHVGLNADGTFVMENLTDDWKRFFKGAGIRKKDLRDPALVQTIRGVMTAQGISLQEPPRNMPREQLSVAYTPEQMKAYDQYMQELADYEVALEQYETQLEEEAERQKEETQHQKMLQWERENAVLIEANKVRNATIPREKRPVAPPMPARREKKPRQNHNQNNNNNTSGGDKVEKRPNPQDRLRKVRPEDRKRSPGGGGRGEHKQRLGEKKPSGGRDRPKLSGNNGQSNNNVHGKGRNHRERPPIPGKTHDGSIRRRKKRPEGGGGERKHRGPRAPVPPALPPLKASSSSASNKSGASQQDVARGLPNKGLQPVKENAASNEGVAKGPLLNKSSQNSNNNSNASRSGGGNSNNQSHLRKQGSSQSSSPSSRGQQPHTRPSDRRRTSIGKNVGNALRRSLTRPSGRTRGGGGGGRGGRRLQSEASKANMRAGRGRPIVPPTPVAPAVVKPPMPAFLQAIQGGAAGGLKAPRQSVLPKFTSVKPEKQDGIMDALRVAMQKRRPMLESTTQVGSGYSQHVDTHMFDFEDYKI